MTTTLWIIAVIAGLMLIGVVLWGLALLVGFIGVCLAPVIVVLWVVLHGIIWIVTATIWFMVIGVALVITGCRNLIHLTNDKRSLYFKHNSKPETA